jgi:hypothetical protein
MVSMPIDPMLDASLKTTFDEMHTGSIIAIDVILFRFFSTDGKLSIKREATSCSVSSIAKFRKF